LQRLLGIYRMQAAAVLVFEALFAADKHFPQRPFVEGGGHAASFMARCLLFAGMGQGSIAHPLAIGHAP
jgi:hypothetical protein